MEAKNYLNQGNEIIKSKLTYLFNRSDKYHDAAEAFKKAGNLYRLSKNYQEASNAYEKAAEAFLQCDEAYESAILYEIIAKCQQNISDQGFINYSIKASEIFIILGKFDHSAKIQYEIAKNMNKLINWK